MAISNQVFIITRTVIKFSIKITHSVQVSNITKPIIEFLWFTTITTIVVAHLDNVLRIAVTIANTMVIWTAVLAVIATLFIEIDQIAFAIVN